LLISALKVRDILEDLTNLVRSFPVYAKNHTNKKKHPETLNKNKKTLTQKPAPKNKQNKIPKKLETKKQPILKH